MDEKKKRNVATAAAAATDDEADESVVGNESLWSVSRPSFPSPPSLHFPPPFRGTPQEPRKKGKREEVASWVWRGRRRRRIISWLHG